SPGSLLPRLPSRVPRPPPLSPPLLRSQRSPRSPCHGLAASRQLLGLAPRSPFLRRLHHPRRLSQEPPLPLLCPSQLPPPSVLNPRPRPRPRPLSKSRPLSLETSGRRPAATPNARTGRSP